MNMNTLEKILTREECEQTRTTQNLGAWVDEKITLFHMLSKKNDVIKRKLLLHEGIFKKFYEEIYPLSLFAQHYYKGCTDIFFKPEIGNQNFDAIILDCLKEPIHEIEITQAHAGHPEYLRMKYFLKHGHVNPLGDVVYSGTKRSGHVIVVENEAIDHPKIIEDSLILIEKAIRKKANRSKNNHNIDTLLLIVFDDFIAFRPDGKEEERKILVKFINDKIYLLKPNFDRVFLVGWSGKSFYEFSLSKIGE